MMTNETPQARMIEVANGCIANGVAAGDLICEMHNCASVDMDANGNVWIADPQAGHWLDDEALAETADWIEAR